MANKYKFTGETKVVFGVTLKQIVAVAAFGVISIGDIGGWIEGENNLSQSGDAWVYGNAWVYGDAWVYGNAWVYGDARVSPINVTAIQYNTTITDDHIKIGCEFHTLKEWSEFDNHRILEMDGKPALKFWKEHKELLLGLAKANGRTW